MSKFNVAMEDKVIQLLRERGPLPMYRIAKELRITYGATQYYVGRLVRRGEVYTVKVGARRYVALNGQDWLNAVTVEDAVEELNAALRRAEIKPKTPLAEALKTLEHKAPHAAEILMFIATALHRRTST
jgi:DNA-binding Lrp family transcriptional regulator